MSRPMWFVGLVKKSFPYRFATARLTRVPLLGGLIERALFKGDDLMVLPLDKVVPIDENVEESAQVILPCQIVEHFIEKAGFLWIMDNCICRDSLSCENYPVDLGCLFLGEAARGINPKLGRSVTREEALRHVRRCREEGLFHLIGRNKIDSVWLNVGPGEKLLTICNCCPCCCVWTIIPDIADRISDCLTRMPGLRIAVTDRCTGCGTCTETCFAGAIHLENGRAVIDDSCKGCGHCAAACPEGAVEVRIEDDSFLEKSIERLSSKVDVT